MEKLEKVMDAVTALPESRQLALFNDLVEVSKVVDGYRRIYVNDEDSLNDFASLWTPWQIAAAVTDGDGNLSYQTGDKYFTLSEDGERIESFNDLFGEWSSEEEFIVECADKVYRHLDGEPTQFSYGYGEVFLRYGIDLEKIEDDEEDEDEDEE